jgi:hypothetical protein
MAPWWNGIHRRLKIFRKKFHESSSLSGATIFFYRSKSMKNVICPNCGAPENKHYEPNLRQRDAMKNANIWFCCHPNHNGDEDGIPNDRGCGKEDCFKNHKNSAAHKFLSEQLQAAQQEILEVRKDADDDWDMKCKIEDELRAEIKTLESKIAKADRLADAIGAYSTIPSIAVALAGYRRSPEEQSEEQ